MKLHDGSDVTDVASKNQTDIVTDRARYRQEASDSLAFAAANAKFLYNSKHKPMTMEPGEKAFVKLHKGYRIPGLENAKLSNQRAGPFTILRRIGDLVYELDLPPI